MTTEFQFASEHPGLAIWRDSLRGRQPRPQPAICPPCRQHGRMTQAIKMQVTIHSEGGNAGKAISVVICLGRPIDFHFSLLIATRFLQG